MARKKILDSFNPRITIRARITITFAVMLTVCGTVILGGVYLFMKFVPTYNITELTGDQAKQSVPEGATYVGTASAFPMPSGEPGTVQDLPVDPGQSATITITNVSDILGVLLWVFIAMILLITALGSLASWIIAGRMLNPLKTINNAAKRAATGSLDHRIALAGPHDEIRDLSDTFDDMLGKLERSFQAHERFSANASHELRTPLATNQTLLEVALADPEVDRESLLTTARRVQETNRQNISLIESLLDLTVIDDAEIEHEKVVLAPLVTNALKDLSSELDEIEVEVLASDIDEECWMRGDPVLLQRLVFNLLQNAVRHNTQGGNLSVSLSRHEGDAQILVINDGDVIDPDIVSSLTEPFFRGRGRVAASGKRRGFGLGLALVANIVELHQGTLELKANPGGGLSARVALPLAGGDL